MHSWPGGSNEALIQDVQSGICPSLEYATDKSCLQLNKSKQTLNATKGGIIQLWYSDKPRKPKNKSYNHVKPILTYNFIRGKALNFVSMATLF